MEDSDDRALVRELAAGGEAALASIYERYRRPVYAQAYAETRSRADAEEMLQDAFLTLWRKRRGIRLVGGSVLPWLLVTAKNLSRNRRRFQDRRAAVPLPEEVSDRESDPVRAAERRELARLLAASMERLDPVDRQVMHLCLVEGMSYSDAAVELRSTHAAVRNRLSRARRTARLRIEAETERGPA